VVACERVNRLDPNAGHGVVEHREQHRVVVRIGKVVEKFAAPPPHARIDEGEAVARGVVGVLAHREQAVVRSEVAVRIAQQPNKLVRVQVVDARIGDHDCVTPSAATAP
jgi:hypothetical protein